MNNLDNLYSLAKEHNIEIFAFSLPSVESMSIMDCDGTCYIGIDPFSIDSYADETQHLAHELGHCITGSFYNKYSDYDIRARHEYKANKWAIKKLIPEDKLQSAVKMGFTELWELSDYFNVPAPFMKKAIEYYKEQELSLVIEEY